MRVVNITLILDHSDSVLLSPVNAGRKSSKLFGGRLRMHIVSLKSRTRSRNLRFGQHKVLEFVVAPVSKVIGLHYSRESLALVACTYRCRCVGLFCCVAQSSSSWTSMWQVFLRIVPHCKTSCAKPTSIRLHGG